MKKYIIIFLCILSFQRVLAQGETNIWYFGRQIGLDFNNGSPVALTDSAMFTSEGCATISNSNGNLLFYTDGSTIYNKNHQIMASGLFGDTSTTQSAIIVPNPTQSNIYYVFTAYSSGLPPGLNYSIVDMNLNGGLGGVTDLNIHLLDNVTEKLTAVLHTNGTDIWVITHGWESTGNSFLAYLVTSSGVNTTPVTSNIGIYTGWSAQYYAGHLKVSPDGTKIVSVSGYNIEIYDFDANAGILSNLQTINRYAYGAEFSPSNEILYTSSHDIYQYDLTASNIEATEILLYSQSPENQLGALQLGPDKKIYMPNYHYLNTINNPDILGVACDFELETIYFGPDQFTYASFGLPQFIQSYFYSSIIVENSCLGDITTFEANSNQTIDGILWDFGDGSTSTLENPTHIYVASGTYTVNATITSGSDTVTRTKNVIISETPIAGTINNYEICSGSFDLDSRDVEILNGQSDILYKVAYFHSLSDADEHINSIDSPYTSTTNNEIITAKIYNANDRDCYDTTTFNLIEYEEPIANIPDDIIICENPYDAIYNFDLTSVNDQVLGSQNENLFNITYHTSQADAEANINNLSNSYTNVSNPETIYVRIENNQYTTCYDTTSFNLEVIQEPEISTIQDLKICDDNNDGIEHVDLSIKDLEVLNGQSNTIFEVTYYLDELDLLNHTNQIQMPFTNVNNTTQIFVKINAINNTDCYNYSSFNLIIHSTPIANSVNNFIICDDSSNDGIENIDLSIFNSEILDTQSAANYNISYHITQQNADDNILPLSQTYTTTSSSNTIYARIENNQNSECFNTTHFNIEVSYLPYANQPDDIFVCDDLSNDGIEEFDLNQQDNIVLNGLNPLNFNISYHLSISDAENNTNFLNTNYSNIENPQTIYTRIENNINTNCFDITSFTLNVLEKPVLTLKNVIPLCESEPLELIVDANYDEYLWSTGETTQSIIISSIGNYSVTATNHYGNISCETTKEIVIIESEVANIDRMIIKDWSQQRNSIIIYVDNQSNFEFSLDGINYQNENYFTELTHGDYTVYIRDKEGCGVITKNITLLFYPKFFTPNGDGYNDYWQIYESETELKGSIIIFNRFGKILSTISPNSNGWDGTYNGKIMLPADYWFMYKRENKETYYGHFSLKN